MEAVLEYNSKILDQKNKCRVHRELFEYTEKNCTYCKSYINICSIIMYDYEDKKMNLNFCETCFEAYCLINEDVLEDTFSIEKIKDFFELNYVYFRNRIDNLEMVRKIVKNHTFIIML